MDHNIFQDSVLPCQLTHQLYPSVDLSLSTLYTLHSPYWSEACTVNGVPGTDYNTAKGSIGELDSSERHFSWNCVSSWRVNFIWNVPWKWKAQLTPQQGMESPKMHSPSRCRNRTYMYGPANNPVSCGGSKTPRMEISVTFLSRHYAAPHETG